MHTDDTPPTIVSVDDRFTGLPTGNRPRTHRAAKKPTGLNWAEIDAQYEASNGVRKDGIWAKGNVRISSRGSGYEQSFVERTDYEEPPIPPRPTVAAEIVVPADLDQVDREEILTGETYEGLVETPKAPTTPRHDYDIWAKDPEPEPATEPADASTTPPRKGGRQRAFTPEQTAELVRRYQAGESTTALAAEYDSNHATIWRTLTREGVKLPIKNSAPDIQSQVIADIEARRPAKARHAHHGHDYLELLYHGLIDSLLDLKQVLLEREATR